MPSCSRRSPFSPSTDGGYARCRASRPYRVLGSVMAHGLTLALIGLVAGLAAALMLTRLMKALLFEVSPNDPATLAGVAALITVVAAAASLVPAVRATRVDPIAALRDE